MFSYIVFLCVVNVGGIGKLFMVELCVMCELIGLSGVCIYIVSGNVVFQSWLVEVIIKVKLECCLEDYVGKFVGVFVCIGVELVVVLEGNLFKMVVFN